MDDKILNLEELWNIFKSKFWIIILVTSITTGVAYYQANKMIVTYQARAKVFIANSDKMMNYYSKQDLELYSNLTDTFKEVITVDDFLQGVLDKNKIDKTAAQIKGGLGFFSSTNSPIITITYSTYDKNQASEILTMICDEFSGEIKNVIAEANPKIIDSVKVFPIYPNKLRVILIGVIVGIIASIGIIFIIDYLDDRVVTKENLEKVLPIPVLGDIPTHEKDFIRRSKNVCSKLQ